MGLLALLSLIVLYISGNAILEKEQKLSNTSIFSNEGSGLSLFQSLGEKLRPGAFQIAQQAYLSESSLSGYDTIALFSPIAPISSREADIFKKFVTDGGTLIVSFHTAAVWENNLANLRKAFSVIEIVKPWKSFKNGETVDVQNDENFDFFKKGEKYAVYGSLQFWSPDCKETDLACYIHFQHVGKGQLLLIAGLPVFSNALIDRADNSKVAFRLINSSRKILIDEYHHFFSSKTIWDLLAYPPFILPLLGLIVGLILFFLLSYSDFYDLPADRPMISGKSYHEVGEQILMNFTGTEKFKPDVLKRLTQDIGQLLPERTDDLTGLLGRLDSGDLVIEQKILQLIRFHQAVLRQKGRNQ